MMKKKNIKGWLYLGLASLILFYTANLYQMGGFSSAFAMALGLASVAAGTFYLAAYRWLGALPTWVAMAAGLLLCYGGRHENGTSVLIWALCCATPLAVSLLWARFKAIRPLAMVALPAAAAGWLGGTLLYCKLHFKTWDVGAITAQIGEKYLLALGQLEKVYAQIYPEGFPQQLTKMLEMLRGLDQTIGFFCIMISAYALLGGFFISVWLADRMAEKRCLGSWFTMIPGRVISWIFMLGYLFSMFLGEVPYMSMMAAFHLFGFFYVFTALYMLLQFLRRKKIPAFLRFLIIGGLFVFAFLTVGGSLLGGYMLLMMAGLAIATLPRVIIVRKNS